MVKFSFYSVLYVLCGINRLNNRKARLARAAKDLRGPSEGDNPCIYVQVESGIRPHNDSSESRMEDLCVPLATEGGHRDKDEGSMLLAGCNGNSKTVVSKATDLALAEGQIVMLVDEQGEEIGKGKVYRVHGKWYGINLDEGLGTCVVDIIELKSERWARLPHPCEATGTSFDQAEKKLGVIRVLWDSNRLLML